MDKTALKGELVDLARKAGDVIMRIYESDFTHQRKSDHSPVTEADVAAERVIVEGLARLTPDIPVVAEEEAAANGLPIGTSAMFWLVDPLDGTKEFIARNGEFTVNIALIVDGAPVMGVVHLPVLGVTYAGAEGRAERREGDAPAEPIRVRTTPGNGAIMTISRSHAAKELAKAEHMGEPIAGTVVAGSSLKFCRVAEGAADLYPRFGPTMEWDTAAGQAVLENAGGSVTTMDGARLRYGKPGLKNPHFIARGKR
jgi:3'(2'), 5'-bisphosphate nucleotidase